MTAIVARVAECLLLFGIRFYQVMLAPLMFSACKFYPSCSHYAVQAIERHGPGRGLRLGAARLWRCRPFAQGGHDPVPDALGDDSIVSDRAASTARTRVLTGLSAKTEGGPGPVTRRTHERNV